MIAALKPVPVWAWGVMVLIIALCTGSLGAAWFWQSNAYGKVIATNESSYQADRTLIALTTGIIQHENGGVPYAPTVIAEGVQRALG